MKLNPDCVRDILMCVESIPDVKCHYVFNRSTIEQDLPKYSYDEVCYHIRQCELSGFFYKAHSSLDGDWSITDLSPKAHEFLANIRQDNIWEGVKCIAEKVGSFSLSTLAAIASNILTELVRNHFRI